jgi:HD-like signal output (HDOD) protein
MHESSPFDTLEPVIHQGSAEKTAEMLAGCELPALGESLQKIIHLTKDDSVSMNAIAKIILRDPGLTAKVLRLANSVAYSSPGGGRIVTVTRALVLLGVNTLSSLCASALVLSVGEQSSENLGRIRDAMAISLHAAAQARALALQSKRPPEAAERVFVQALLSDIGEVAFWAHASEEADNLHALLASGVPDALAQTRVLGFSLQSLGERLREKWGVNLPADPEVEAGRRIARAVANGWSGSDMRKVVAEVSASLRREPAAVLKLLKDTADEAARVALAQGLVSVAGRISPDIASEVASREEPQSAASLEKNSALSVVSTISDMLKLSRGAVNVPQLIGLALEGVLRGAGVDRVAFVLVNKEGSRVSARLTLGECSDELFRGLQLPVDAEIEAVLSLRSCVVAGPSSKVQSRLLRQAVGSRECLLGPVHVKGRKMGFFYADNKVSERPLREGSLQSFQVLVEQTEMLLNR